MVQRPQTFDLGQNYRYWRWRYKQGWGLAWYLAAEISDRFYQSHAIRPAVIEHEGLGYYGIALEQVPCRIVHQSTTLGRLTAAGNVENWLTGSPGDHGLKLVDRAEEGESLDHLLREAIQHLRLPTFPTPGHAFCRHRRWGSSAVLVFRLASLIALRWNEKVAIWNHPEHMRRAGEQFDPKREMSEHPGYLVISTAMKRVVFAGDGRVLTPTGLESVWERYMHGDSQMSLLRAVEAALGLT